MSLSGSGNVAIINTGKTLKKKKERRIEAVLLGLI
jgi:hypothetical protein